MTTEPKIPDGWRRVSFAGDVNEAGDCSLCGQEYADCLCPGPTQDGYVYAEFDGVLCARPAGVDATDGLPITEEVPGSSIQKSCEGAWHQPGWADKPIQWDPTTWPRPDFIIGQGSSTPFGPDNWMTNTIRAQETALVVLRKELAVQADANRRKKARIKRLVRVLRSMRRVLRCNNIHWVEI